jgi:hypothetical protein
MASFSGVQWVVGVLAPILKVLKADIEANRLPPRENQGGRFLMAQSDGDLAWAIPSTNSDGGNARSIYLPSQVSDGGTAHG